MSTPAINPAKLPATKMAEIRQGDYLPTLLSGRYGAYEVRPVNFVLSFALHTLAVLALLISANYLVTHQQQIKSTFSGIVTDISPYVLPPSKDQAGGGGGGGDRDKLAASRGSPPKFSREQFTPPAGGLRKPDPKLAVAATGVGPPAHKRPQRRHT